MAGHVLTARDYFVVFIREQAEQRFRTVNSRTDLEGPARLLALALYLEGLPLGDELCVLLDFAAPTAAEREFPSLGTRQLLAQWADNPPGTTLALFARILIEAEARDALEADLAAL